MSTGRPAHDLNALAATALAHDHRDLCELRGDGVSSKPAIIRQRDVTRIVKGYAAAGISLGIVVRDGEVRFLPVDDIKSAAEPSTLEAWRARRNAGEVDGAA